MGPECRGAADPGQKRKTAMAPEHSAGDRQNRAEMRPPDIVTESQHNLEQAEDRRRIELDHDDEDEQSGRVATSVCGQRQPPSQPNTATMIEAEKYTQAPRANPSRIANNVARLRKTATHARRDVRNGSGQLSACRPARATSGSLEPRKLHPDIRRKGNGTPAETLALGRKASSCGGAKALACGEPLAMQDASAVQPPVTLICLPTAGRGPPAVDDEIMALRLREIASSMARCSAASSAEARIGARRSAASSCPRHI